MCGIVGFISNSSYNSDKLIDIVSSMSKVISHRGPDDSGVWSDESFNITLAHQRLSILDLSNAGHQPMLSPSERYIVAFNGEIYNHLELRMDLSKKYNNISWRGTSDTETLVTAIDKYGVLETLNKVVGMFAFALWDMHEKELYLVRDRFGEKPLYYGWSHGNFIFASELKSLKKLG